METLVKSNGSTFLFSDVSLSLSIFNRDMFRQFRSQYWLGKGALDIQNCCYETTYLENKVVSFLSKAHRVTHSISIWF